MHTQPIVFIDIETTGLSPSSARIIEIGALRVENHAVVATYRQLLHPETIIPGFITSITGITNDTVQRAPTFAAIASDLKAILQGALFAAHNVHFDYSFIQAEYARLDEAFSSDRFCTAKLSRKLFPQYRSHSLAAIIERHGYQVEARHRAFDDAQVLYHFYQELQATRQDDLQQTINRLVIKHKVV